ncbi:hypothetical protein [Paenibacillus donghaensis]|uniref:hypothetical protein n=1 Tax=Paenibacillus donghaensis TaxID=414771 RepID=UPI0012FD9CEE|nr:hypothetical protein [Paenibacillus donghaensis]
MFAVTNTPDQLLHAAAMNRFQPESKQAATPWLARDYSLITRKPASLSAETANGYLKTFLKLFLGVAFLGKKTAYLVNFLHLGGVVDLVFR